MNLRVFLQRGPYRTTMLITLGSLAICFVTFGAIVTAAYALLWAIIWSAA